MNILWICAALFSGHLPPAVIPLAELTQELCEEIITGLAPSLAVEIPAGSLLPIQFGLSGDFAELEAEDLVRIKTHLYVRFDGENLRFSTDLNQWYTFAEIATGTASAGFGIGEDGPFIRLLAKTNQRPNVVAY